MPWPVKDREVVLQRVLRLDKRAKKMVATCKILLAKDVVERAREAGIERQAKEEIDLRIFHKIAARGSCCGPNVWGNSFQHAQISIRSLLCGRGAQTPGRVTRGKGTFRRASTPKHYVVAFGYPGRGPTRALPFLPKRMKLQ